MDGYPPLRCGVLPGCVFAWGCASATFYTLAGTVVQQITPEDTLGRVFGVYGTLGSVRLPTS